MSSTDRPRELALKVLCEAERGMHADRMLDQARASFDGRDSGFILELTYGVLRNRSRIDWLLDRFSKQPVSSTDDWTRNILRLGAYQLLFLDRVPASAAVNTSTELAKLYGKKHGYVNGLLRTLERKKNDLPLPDYADAVKRLATLHSHPEWLVRRWVSRFGADQTEEVLRKNNEDAPLIIRANSLKGTADDLITLLASQGAAARKSRFSPTGVEILSSPGITTLDAFHEGRFLVQDEAAQLVTLMLDPKPGESVLDACAAPGGKATYLAELMGNIGEVVALESDKKRIDRIRENSSRLGITIVRPKMGDAAKYKEGQFDRILIDAPCSGLGVLRRHPDGRWTKTEKAMQERSALQKKILANCAGLLKPGGVLVYATCTTEPEENEEVVRDFLANHPEFTLDDPRPFLPPAAARLVGPDLFFRTFPDEPAMDGFFSARILRTG
ncbi:MAG: 16S rRNA (cytosine(967)-C(5))-methyltransferase RsmB [Nitrospirota bacterium]